MKKIFIYLVLLLTAYTNLYAADTVTRVLFIGNSFTAAEDVPGIVRSFADKAGLQMEIAVHAPGGISVGDVGQGDQAHMNNPAVYDMIKNNDWDFVVLQDNQGRFVDGDGIFPDTNKSKVIAGHLKIRDSMRYYNPCARMLFFSGWAWKSGYPGLGDGMQLIDNIYENYAYLNKTANEIIAPIGSAWKRSILQLPGIDLWSADEAHQSTAGGYLAAAVIFSSMFRINTEDVAYSHNLDTAHARAMRRIAYQTVNDSVKKTNLSSTMPEVVYNGSALVAPTGYSNYQWFKNDTLISTSASNIYIPPTGKNCYHVILTNSKGCQLTSLTNCITATTHIPISTKTPLQLFPNPANDMINLTVGNEGKNKQYTITDMVGHVLKKGSFKEDSINISVQALPPGVYVCNLLVDTQVMHIKFTKEE